MKQPARDNTYQTYLIATVIVLSAFCIYFLILSVYLNTAFFTVINAFCKALYVPNFNIFITMPFLGIAAIQWAYHLLLIINIAAILYFIVLSIIKRNYSYSYLQRFIVSIMIIFCVLFAILTQIGRLKFFTIETLLYARTTEPQKNSIIFPDEYPFVQETITKLDRHYDAAFMTDYVNEHALNLRYRAAFKYHFYPIVKLPVDHREQLNYDALLIFHKKNPLQAVPEGFRVVHKSSDLKYVFAIRVDE